MGTGRYLSKSEEKEIVNHARMHFSIKTQGVNTNDMNVRLIFNYCVKNGFYTLV